MTSLMKIFFAVTLTLQTMSFAFADDMAPPPGFHRMPNGDIMANNPSNAVAPDGYVLSEGGILRKATEVNVEAQEAKPVTSAEFGKVPDGYHVMSDGTLMANSPSTAIAPDGFYLLPDGTLMRDGSSANPSAQSRAGGLGGMLMGDYKYVRMNMSGMLDTTNDVSASQAVDPNGDYPFMMAPTDMDMDMHMFMLMYHTRSYMLMAMFHYMSNTMGMLSTDGTKSTMKSSGIADTVLTASFSGPNRLSFLFGLNLPTGSINQRGPMTHLANVVQNDVKYPYGMQLGSGTFDLIQGISIQGGSGVLNWGVGYEYTYRFLENKFDYTLGDILMLNSWTQWSFTNTWGITGKLDYRSVGQTEGVDPELEENRFMSPTMDATSYGGRRADLGIKLKYENAQMTSVSAEFIKPVYQNLFGPQMKTNWMLGLGVGYMF